MRDLSNLLYVWIHFAIPTKINGDTYLVPTEFLKCNGIQRILLDHNLIDDRGNPINDSNNY